MKITIIGSRGFVGSHFKTFFERRGIRPYCPQRDEPLTGRDLGTLLYCAGITADFRNHPAETIEAHTCHPARIATECKTDRIVYFSSARVYNKSDQGHEDALLSLDPADSNDLYNATKIAGEYSIRALSENYHIIRPTNIVGPNWNSSDFLFDIIREAFVRKHVTMHTAPESEKDYVGIDTVVLSVNELLERDALSGIYNVSSGRNSSNRHIATLLNRFSGCGVDYAENAPYYGITPISNAKIVKATGIVPPAPEDVLERIIALAARHYSTA